MMLPVEILTLILLATHARAIPRPEEPSRENSTASEILPSLSSGPSKIPGWTHGESTQSGFESEPTQTDDRNGGTLMCTGTCGPLVVIEQPTETGFETVNKLAKTSQANIPNTKASPSHNANVIVTNNPIVIGVHTNIEPTGGHSHPAPSQEFTLSWQEGAPNVPAPTSIASTGEDLLTDIISRIAQPGSQPTQPASPLGTGSLSPQPAPSDNRLQQWRQGTAQVTPGVTASPEVEPAIALGGQVTLGPATLILTPGLSTMVGTGSAATYVGIAIDRAGETLITISSSGTAQTATIINTPVTMTVPVTGFDASITDEAQPAAHDSSSVGTAAAATSSKGGAPERKPEVGWMASGILGFVGLVIAF